MFSAAVSYILANGSTMAVSAGRRVEVRWRVRAHVVHHKRKSTATVGTMLINTVGGSIRSGIPAKETSPFADLFTRYTPKYKKT